MRIISDDGQHYTRTTRRLQSPPTCGLSVPAAERQHPPIQIVAYRSCKLDVQ